MELLWKMGVLILISSSGTETWVALNTLKAQNTRQKYLSVAYKPKLCGGFDFFFPPIKITLEINSFFAVNIYAVKKAQF